MSAQILFVQKNKLDISRDEVGLTSSEADDFADFVRNRSNSSAWITSGTLDLNNTNIVVDFVTSVDLDFIALVKHNFKSYKIEYWNGSSYQLLIDVTNNSTKTTSHEFTIITTTKIKLTIRGTFVADDDKILYQLIASEKIGRFNGWPTVKNPIISRERLRSKMLSGKESIKEQLGSFSCTLDLKVYSDSQDLDIIETIFQANEGFLLWLCGGDEAQFSSKRLGYRLEDFYLVKCSSEYKPEWYKGLYTSGQVVNLNLQEVID